MAKIIQIDGIYYMVKNNGLMVRLRSGRNGPDASYSETIVINAFATGGGFDDSAIASATFIIHN